MGIVVGIAIVVVLSLSVASAFGGERGDQENRFSDPLRYIDEEELAELEEEVLAGLVLVGEHVEGEGRWIMNFEF